MPSSIFQMPKPLIENNLLESIVEFQRGQVNGRSSDHGDFKIEDVRTNQPFGIFHDLVRRGESGSL